MQRVRPQDTPPVGTGEGTLPKRGAKRSRCGSGPELSSLWPQRGTRSGRTQPAAPLLTHACGLLCLSVCGKPSLGALQEGATGRAPAPSLAIDQAGRLTGARAGGMEGRNFRVPTSLYTSPQCVSGTESQEKGVHWGGRRSSWATQVPFWSSAGGRRAPGRSATAWRESGFPKCPLAGRPARGLYVWVHQAVTCLMLMRGPPGGPAPQICPHQPVTDTCSCHQEFVPLR